MINSGVNNLARYQIIDSHGTVIDKFSTTPADILSAIAAATAVLFADGSVSAPSISFTTATGDGFYHTGTGATGSILAAVNGVNKTTLDVDYLTLDVDLKLADNRNIIFGSPGAQISVANPATGNGGGLSLIAGAGVDDGDGGWMSFSCGDAGATSGSGGGFTFTAGNSSVAVLSTGTGGGFTFNAGQGGSFGGDGGTIQINAGDAQGFGALGGDIILKTGVCINGQNGTYKFDYAGRGTPAIFNFDLIDTSAKTFTFPNASGTIALSGDFMPLIVGGDAAGSNITYKSTTGTGTAAGIAHQWIGGTNGGTVIATMLNNGNVGIGTASPASILSVNLSNTDYTNTNGAGSHFVMTNPSATGQNVISSYINGNLVAKWRTDYAGNINWIAGSGYHAFYTGGDFPTGTAKMTILNNGNVGIGVVPPNSAAKLIVAGSTIVGTAALATNATDGFLYIPTSAGTPTGVPTAQTGTVATEYDTTNHALKIYDSEWNTLVTSKLGGFYSYDKAIPFNITVADTYHAFHLVTAGDIVSGSLRGFTFNAGRAVDANIASEANGTGGKLRIACSAAHGLTTGDFVVLGNMNNAGHNKPTHITTDGTNPTTEFLCDDINYVAGAGTSAGTVDQPACLKASTGSAGIYWATFNLVGTAANPNKDWRWELHTGITPNDNIVSERTTTATLASMTASGHITIADGDYVWLAGKNITDTTDYTVKHANIHLHKIG